MKVRPLFALALLASVFATALTVLSFASLPEPLFVVALVSTVHQLLFHGRHVRLFAGLTLGSWIVVQGASVSPATSNLAPLFEQKGRVCSTICDVSVSGTYILLDGELDLASTPATNCKIWVRIPSELPWHLCPGQRVVGTVVVHRPSKPDIQSTFSEQAWAMGSGASFVGTATSLSLMQEASMVNRLISSVASYCKQCISSSVSQPISDVLIALLIGDTGRLTANHREVYALSGTAHVLAVSGTHVAVLAGIVLALIGGTVRRWWQVCLVVFVLTSFVLVTGAEAPAMRALLMSICLVAGKMRQKTLSSLNLLGAVFIVQIVAEPFVFYNVGFILSIAAVVSLVIIAPKLSAMFSRFITEPRNWKRWLSNTFALNIAASAGVCIPSAMMFGQYALWSPLVNLMVVPLMMVAMVSGLIILATSWFSFTIAGWAAWTAEAAIQLSELVVYYAAHHTPLVSSTVSIALALIHLTMSLWILRSTSIKAIVSRIVIGVVITLTVLPLLPKPPNGIHLALLSPSAVRLHVRSDTATREVILSLRRGIPFVRSQHDNNRTRR